MKIQIELYASLMDRLPPGEGRFNRSINVEDNLVVQKLIEQFRITDEEAHIVLVNGLFVCGDDRNDHLLKEGDTVSIWPPVAGG